MNSKIFQFKTLFLALFAASLVGLTACEKAKGDPSEVFLKADPEVDAEMNYSPRTLRVFLAELPEVSDSSMTLTGPDGDVALDGLHTMGADDLMIEIVDFPLASGEYMVEWTAKFAGDKKQYSGSYRFTVAE